MGYINESYVAEWGKAYAEVMEQSVASMLVGLDTPVEKLFRLIDESSGDTTAIERLSMKKDAYMQIINSVVANGQQTAIALVDKKFKFNYELKISEQESKAAEKKVEKLTAEIDNVKEATNKIKSDKLLTEANTAKTKSDKLLVEANTDLTLRKRDTEADARVSKKVIIEQEAEIAVHKSDIANYDKQIKEKEASIVTETSDDKIREIQKGADIVEQKALDLRVRNGWNGTVIDTNSSMAHRDKQLKLEQARLTMRQRIAYDEDREQKLTDSASKGYAMVFESLLDSGDTISTPDFWTDVSAPPKPEALDNIGNDTL